MKIIKSSLIFSLMLLTQSIFLAADVSCDPHLSIENQKTKRIPKEAQALLAKVINDQVDLSWPVEVCKCWLSSLFGPRKSGYHNGIDLAASQGTPVYAVADGAVEASQKSLDKNGYGNMILIVHCDGDYKTRYAHLHSLFVSKGDLVEQGQKIGTVGATGRVVAKTAKSDPSHLHFEVYRNGSRINPLIPLFAVDPAWVERNSK